MRITSKFRDYYDSCLGFGIDPLISYPRITQVIRPKYMSMDVPPRELLEARRACNSFGPECSSHSDPMYRQKGYSLCVVVVGVAGKLYKLIHRSTGRGLSSEEEYLTTSESLTEEQGSELLSYRSRLTYRDAFKSPICWENPEVFCELDAPVFFFRENYLVVNPNLSEYKFGKILGGIDAFQQISAFIAGTLQDKSRLQIVTDDKSLAVSKGFDKHSFRKSKTKRGKK